MAITSPRFIGNKRLERAAENRPPIAKGEKNRVAVAILQKALVDLGYRMPRSTKLGGAMDGIFGIETFQTVRKFQRENGLVNAAGHSDGIIGRNTMSILDKLLQVTVRQAVAYDVPLIPQPTDDSCWAASMAMMASFARNQLIPARSIAASVGLNLNSSYGWSYIHKAIAVWGLQSLNVTPYIADFPQLLLDHGPLWLVVTGDPSHSVVTGTDGSRYSWNDPSPVNVGTRNVLMPMARLAKFFGGATKEVGAANFQVLYNR